MAKQTYRPSSGRYAILAKVKDKQGVYRYRVDLIENGEGIGGKWVGKKQIYAERHARDYAKAKNATLIRSMWNRQEAESPYYWARWKKDHI